MSTQDFLQRLADRVRFDLESAGLSPAAHRRTDGAVGGFAIYIDEGHVHVDWFTHHRLDEADLDAVVLDDPLFDDVTRRYETARTAILTALETILTGCGYHLQKPALFGFGYTVTAPTSSTPPGRPPDSTQSPSK